MTRPVCFTSQFYHSCVRVFERQEEAIIKTFRMCVSLIRMQGFTPKRLLWVLELRAYYRDLSALEGDTVDLWNICDHLAIRLLRGEL